MKLYRADISLLSPTGTPWHADTIFGHLCWQIAFHQGDEALSEFIRRCEKGDPPFVVSDGFPAGVMPRPQAPRRTEEAGNVVDYRKAKRKRKAKWLNCRQFKQVQHGQDFEGLPPEAGWSDFDTLHASIDRNTNRTGGEGSQGRLFSTRAEIPTLPIDSDIDAPKGTNLQLYIRAEDEGIEMFEELTRLLQKSGFGRDKSTGSGHFKLIRIIPAPQWDQVDEPDGIICLSGMVPAENDPIDGRWRLRTKYGRLGEHFALGELPFKRPIVQLEPGAVFRLNGAVPRPWYGRIVRDVAPAQPEVVQGCQAVALPLVFDKR